jgi:single-stranded-DNA-specific exonuclease
LRRGPEKLRAEWCIRIDGKVLARDASLVNPKIPTGEIEVFVQDLEVLGAVAPGGATLELCEQIEAAGPFGPSNPAPRLAIPDAVPSGVRIVGNGHAQVRFQGPGGSVPAIAFGASESGLADLLQSAATARRPLHAAGRLEIDDWGGRRKAKLRLDDLAEPE